VPRLVFAGAIWLPLGSDGVTVDRIQPVLGLNLTALVHALGGT
jgi:hypothetical protein